MRDRKARPERHTLKVPTTSGRRYAYCETVSIHFLSQVFGGFLAHAVWLNISAYGGVIFLPLLDAYETVRQQCRMVGSGDAQVNLPVLPHLLHNVLRVDAVNSAFLRGDEIDADH